jgi:hypothetical protein
MSGNRPPIDPEEATAIIQRREDTRRSLLGKAGLIAGGVGLGALARPGDALAHETSFTVFNVKDHGGDINATIAEVPAQGGIVYLPQGQYILSSPVVVDKPVTFVGAGSGYEFNSGSWLQSPATEIKWSGGAGPMFKVDGTASGPARGVRWESMGLDGSGVATKGFDLDRWQGGVIRDVVVRNLAQANIYHTSGIGIHLKARATPPDSEGTTENLIDHVTLACPIGLRCDGNEDLDEGPTANTHNNSFHHFTVRFGGDGTNNPNGIILRNADNNSFFKTRCYRPSSGAGSGYGVKFSVRGRSNYFFHLSSHGGVLAEAPISAGKSNVIFAYDRENGQPAPTVNSGASLTWTEDGTNGQGWFLGESGFVLPEASTTPESPAAGSQARVYMKGDKLIVQYDDSGTVRYKYLALTGSGTSWTHTTTPP